MTSKFLVDLNSVSVSSISVFSVIVVLFFFDFLDLDFFFPALRPSSAVTKPLMEDLFLNDSKSCSLSCGPKLAVVWKTNPLLSGLGGPLALGLFIKLNSIFEER